jgi:hypothetical protein
MRIALLLYGEARRIETGEVCESHKKFIPGADVFCHTWFSKGCDFKPTNHGTKNLPTLHSNDNTIDLINSHYDPLVLEYEPHITFKISDKLKNCKYLENDDLVRNELWASNQVSQLCSISRVGHLFENYCKNKDVTYDFIVLARYDLVILDFPRIETLSRDFLYLSNAHEHFPDLFFIFSPKFIKSLYTFDNLEIIDNSITEETIPQERVWGYWNECLKYNNFLLHYDKSFITSVTIREKRAS